MLMRHGGRTSDLVTFQLWSMFVARYPNHHELGLQPYRRKLPNPTMSLADYVRPVTALKMEWITLLSIGMTAVPTAEYASLAAIPNLGGLDLLSHNEYQTRAPVHDGLVRAWSRAAKHDACFSALRVLSLRRWPDVTARTLGYLGVFPALRYFVLQARSDPSGLILRPVPLKGWSGELRLTRPETMPELFRKAVRDADASGHSAGPVAQLELELGRPYHDLLPYRHDLVSPCGPSLTGRTSRPYPVIYRRDDLQHQQRAEGESSTNDPMGAVAPGTTAPGATPTFVVRASKRRALQEVLAELDDRVQRRQPSPGEKRLKI